jgi:uracil DNA glycosylase
MSRLKRKYQHFGLEKSYLDICEQMNKIDLVIMGKDPFPNDAMSIPFCKKNWKLLSNKGQAGFSILNSIDYKNFNINNYLNGKCTLTPQKYFHKLAKKGIVMLNASYYF